MSVTEAVPAVSVLIPAFNAGRYLRQCLDSVLAQSWKNIQIVVVDDGSSDDTLAICRKYEEQYSRISVYTQPNSGVAAARNALLERMTGEYVLFVDADDWIEPDMVEYLTGLAVSDNADIAVCGFLIDDAKAPVQENVSLVWEREYAVKEFLRHVEFNGSLCNKLIKTSILRGIKFQGGISYGEDALFIWKILQCAGKITVSNRRLYHYRMNSASISHQAWLPAKMGSGHLVWEQICADTEKQWPQYSAVAVARFALEDMWGLFFASLSGYTYDENIRERQENVRRNLGNIRRSGLARPKYLILAFLLSHWYGAGKAVKLLRKVLK